MNEFIVNLLIMAAVAGGIHYIGEFAVWPSIGIAAVIQLIIFITYKSASGDGVLAGLIIFDIFD